MEFSKINPPSTGLIYDVSLKGHRPSYFEVFEKELGFQPLAGSIWGNFIRLLRAPRLFCLTVDDYLSGFLLLGLFRACLGRPTLGLSLRVENMFQRMTLKRLGKRAIYKILMGLPKTTVVSLKPFYLEPRLSEIVGAWIYDPQWWDLQVISSGASTAATPHTAQSSAFTPSLSSTPVASMPGAPPPEWQNQIERLAELKKPIVALPGHQSLIKGLEIFTQFAQRNPQYTCVCIGPNTDIPETFWEAFQQVGGTAIVTTLSESDLAEIYRKADIIWACYRSDYDQSSGIFGRALQRGKPVCVREGSFLHQFAVATGAHRVLVVSEDGRLVSLDSKKSQDFNQSLARAFSVNVVRDVLELSFDPRSISNVESV